MFLGQLAHPLLLQLGSTVLLLLFQDLQLCLDILGFSQSFHQFVEEGVGFGTGVWRLSWWGWRWRRDVSRPHENGRLGHVVATHLLRDGDAKLVQPVDDRSADSLEFLVGQVTVTTSLRRRIIAAVVVAAAMLRLTATLVVSTAPV